MAQTNAWNNRLKAVAVGMGIALSALTIRHWYGTFTVGHPPCQNCRADFPGFYAAGKLVWHAPAKLYAYEDQLVLQRAIDARIGDSILPFAYPPFTAVVLMPFAWLPFRGAFVAITIANALLLAGILTILVRRLELRQGDRTWLLLGVFCNFGVHSVILQGQTSLIVLGILAAFMFSFEKFKNRAGLWAGVMFFKPQFLAVPFMALWFQRRWRALLIGALVLAVLAILSFALVGADGLREYFGLLKFYGTTESGAGSYPRGMHNLRALAQYWLPFRYAPYLWLALALPLALATMWLNAQAPATANGRRYLWIANFLAMMLLTPHLYPHDLALLIVPNALVLKLLSDSPSLLANFGLVMLGVLPILPSLLGSPVPPVVPVILLGGFVWCWQSLRQRSDLREWKVAL